MSANPTEAVFNPARNERLRRVTAAALGLAQTARDKGLRSLSLTLCEESMFASLSAAKRRQPVSITSAEGAISVARYLVARVEEDLLGAHGGATEIERWISSLAYNLAEEASDEFYGLENGDEFLISALPFMVSLRDHLRPDDPGYQALINGAIQELRQTTGVTGG